MKERLKVARELAARKNAEAIKLRDELMKDGRVPTTDELAKLQTAVTEFKDAHQAYLQTETLSQSMDGLDQFAEQHARVVKPAPSSDAPPKSPNQIPADKLHKE